MQAITSQDSRVRTPLDVALLALLLVVVGGGSLLLSAAESTSLVDGAVAWREDSPLRAVVRLLCLDYRFPTIYAGEVKNYLLGIGVGLAALVLTVAVIFRPRTVEIVPAAAAKLTLDRATQKDFDPTAQEDTLGRAGLKDDEWSLEDDDSPSRRRVQVAPFLAAQILVALYVLWSFASNGWSAAPESALGGSILLAVFFLWPFCLGHGLSRAGVVYATRLIVVVTAAASVIAVWYYYGRNPVLRAKFPFGNPNFLAAGLLPGLLLAVAMLCEGISKLVLRTARTQGLWLLLFGTFVLGIGGWAFYLADTRGAMVGLGTGLLAIPFFRLPGRWKWVPAAVGAACLVGAWFGFAGTSGQPSPTGRSETMRLRGYAWSYAERMFNDKPLTGHGQGGFALHGDSFAVGDVMNDPLVFDARLSHAHNEWLEVMADLGAVGIVLIAAALAMTLHGGAQALKKSHEAIPMYLGTRSHEEESWTLIGLLAALVALIVEECFGVGLRASGVPTYFYTVLGLIWASCRSGTSPMIAGLATSTPFRVTAGIVGGGAALFAATMTHADFVDAQNGFRVESAMNEEKYEDAIRYASRAVHRLSPQRRLEGLYRLSEAHMQIARGLEQRAADREARAKQGDTPDPLLLDLARQDRMTSDEHCRNGSTSLLELVRRSPGYLNHGWLANWLNVIQANNAEARGDRTQRDLFVSAAGAALEAELLRQPYEPALAESYFRVGYGAADLPILIDVLARPLRYNRIGAAYVNLLSELTADPAFEERLAPILEQARNELLHPQDSSLPREAATPGIAAAENWAPEKMRLSAAILFSRGDYEGARAAAELAAKGYERFVGPIHFGAAASYAELADCRFISDPLHPAAARESAQRALAAAPDSEPGRAFRSAVKQRMLEYCLAEGDEAQAEQLLRETGPAGATAETIRREMGLRYRQLVRSLLLRRRENSAMPKPATDLLPHLQGWVRRAIELHDDDPVAHFLAADLAFHVGDDEAAAGHLRGALNRGLPVEEARQFLTFTRQKKPDSKPLQELWEVIESKAARTDP